MHLHSLKYVFPRSLTRKKSDERTSGAKLFGGLEDSEQVVIGRKQQQRAGDERAK